MKNTEKSKAPALVVYTVEGEGDKAHWTRIGAAWAHADGEGFNISLSALPLNGRLTLRSPNKSDEESQ